jgi:hypothetical protein
MPVRDNGIEINSLGLPIPLRSRGGPYIYGHMDFLCRDKDGLANLPTPSSPRNQAVSLRSIDVRVHCAKTGCPSPVYQGHRIGDSASWAGGHVVADTGALIGEGHICVRHGRPGGVQNGSQQSTCNRLSQKAGLAAQRQNQNYDAPY